MWKIATSDDKYFSSELKVLINSERIHKVSNFLKLGGGGALFFRLKFVMLFPFNICSLRGILLPGWAPGFSRSVASDAGLNTSRLQVRETPLSSWIRYPYIYPYIYPIYLPPIFTPYVYPIYLPHIFTPYIYPIYLPFFFDLWWFTQ